MTTDRDTAPSAPHPETAPGDEEANARPRAGAHAQGTQTAETAPAGVTQRGRQRSQLLDQLTPPEPWRHRPASLAAMWRYARRGGWTGTTGPARTAGVWWYRLVAVPVTLLCHYAAWIIARPSRTVALAIVWAVAMQVPPLRAAADAVLPWPSWPIGP